MPATINPIRKELLKQNIIRNKGKDVKGAMIAAGYTESTAKRTYANASVKLIQAEILQELKYSHITPDLMIKRLDKDRDLAERKGDIATMTRVDELLCKSIALLTDKTEISSAEKEDNQFSLERLSRIKQASTN